MVLVDLNHLESSDAIILSAHYLATKLDKKLAFSYTMSQKNNKDFVQIEEQKLRKKLELLEVDDTEVVVLKREAIGLNYTQLCEENEVSFLFVQWTSGHRKEVMGVLSACRELRIPYLYFKDTYNPLILTKVLMPVGYLEEEVEKGQFASAFGRFCHSEITILQANDYGTKAERNVQKMISLFDKFSFKYNILRAKSDSFKLEFEAQKLAELDKFDMLLVSASRDYGLDDLFFGPKEYHLLKKARMPILLINPRGDLYALCD